MASSSLVNRQDPGTEVESADLRPVKDDQPSVGRTGTVTFRPYTDLARAAGPPKKRFRADDPDESHLAAVSGTTVDHLYPELLCLLFSYLDVESKGRAAQVCSKWRDAAYSKCAWRGATARLHLRKSSQVVFASLVKRGIVQVEVLSLRKSLNELIAGLPNLAHLDLSGCFNLSDGILEAAFPTTSGLQSLSLAMCKRITDDGLAVIAASCPGLESLELGGCTRLTNDGLRIIAGSRMRTTLRRLNLRSCWQITDAGISHLAGMTTTSAEDDDPTAAATEVGLTAIEELVLQDCQKLSDAALRMLQEGLSHHHRAPLRVLNLSFCASITDSGLRSLGRMATLEELNLRACDNVSDLGLGYLAEASIGLHTLDVSFCERITDAALGHLASGLFSLRRLALVGCRRIGDDGLAKMAKTLLDLDTLSVGQCGRLTDRSLELIGRHLKQLRRIDLYGCSRLTAAGIESLRASLPRLVSMNLGLLHQPPPGQR